MQISLNKFELLILSIGVIAIVAIIFIFDRLGVTVLQSDPYMYLQQSQHWWQKDLHLPGYAFILWLVNTITFHALPSTALLHIVAAATWFGSTFSFIKIVRHLDLEKNIAAILISAYAFFPFLGLTFAAWPLADSAVWLIINLLVLGCLQRNWTMLTVAIAIGLLIHKVLWGFCALSALYALVYLGYPFWKLILSGAPLVAFWAWIALQGHGALWMISHDFERHFPSYSNLPIFDGILGTILEGGSRNLAKGGLLLAIYLFELVLFIFAVRKKHWLGLAIILPLLLVGATVNQWLAIAVLRFGKISLVVAALLLGLKNFKIPKLLASKTALAVLLMFLLASQFAYARYMKSFFEAGGVLEEKLQREQAIMESKGLPTYERGESGGNP